MSGIVVPYALSVHSFVDKVGSYAGFAAIIGVALLVIMFFVNARETSALRARAEEAEERLYRLEYHADQMSRNAAAAAARPAPQAAPATGVTPAPASAPIRAPAGRQPVPGWGASPPTTPQENPAAAEGAARPPARAPAVAAAAGAGVAGAGVASRAFAPAPAGVGAPALSSATRLIPLADGPGSNGSAATGPAGGGPAPPTPAAAPRPRQPVPPPPSTAAAAGVNGVATAPAPAPAAPSTAGVVPPPAGLGAPAPPRTARRDYTRRGSDSGGRRVGRGSIAAATVLLAVIIVAAVLVITHHGSSSRTAARGASSSATNARRPKSSAAARGRTSARVTIHPGNVTVAVLNGTSTSNLAHDVLTKLTQAGYRQGATGNATAQTLSSTVVGYAPGARADALAVAKSLSLSANSVHAVSASDHQVACSASPAGCPDQVVVTVGSDLNSLA